MSQLARCGVRIADSLLNKSEEVAFRELEAITNDNALRLFAKPRLSDVILKDGTYLPPRTFDFSTRSHVDFVVTDENSKPILAVEYDGPSHSEPRQQERDRIKDELCGSAGMGILRITANHVTKLFRGMSILRWIIEVMELEKAFYREQEAGHIPWDEPFDASFLWVGGKREYPWHLSLSANGAIRKFLEEFPSRDKGLQTITATDTNQNLRELAFLWAGDQVIWAKTAVRHQNVEFPAYDLLDHLGTCELHLALSRFQRGDAQATTGPKLQRILQEFCSRYDAHPSHSSDWGGRAPFSFSWNPASGWNFGRERRFHMADEVGGLP
jgi:hypothetical protein